MSDAVEAVRRPWLLELPRRLFDYAWDNPSAEHDARAILSAPKVGIWLGLEVLLLCIGSLAAFAILPQEDSTFHQAMVKVGTGQYLISASLITLTAFLTLTIPLRSAGLLEGPRWRGYMDQVVTTGITPLRYFAGKWATSQAFFLSCLVASLPITVLFGLLGGASVGRTAAAYLLIYAYCNVLLLVTLALGAMVHEVLGVLVVWHVFALMSLLDYVPLPSTLAAGTPHRFLIQPFVESLAGSAAGTAMRIYGDPVLFGTAIPWPVYALGLWGAVSALAIVTLALGPLHRFLPGMNNFGSVVLPGDTKRLFFRRLRPMLNRRVELAFLFENRGPRLVRWMLPLRALQQLAGFALFSTILLGLVFHPVTIAEIRNYTGISVLHGFACAVVLLVFVYMLTTGKSDASESFPLAPGLRAPLLSVDVIAFLAGCAILIGLHGLTFAAAWPDLVLSAGTRWSSIQSPEELAARSSLNLALMLSAAVILFLLVKAFGCRSLNRDAAYLGGAVCLGALVVLPFLFLAGAEAARRADDVSVHWLARPLLVFAQASPGMPMLLAEEGWQVNRWGPQSHWLLGQAYWFWSSGLIVLLLGTLSGAYRSAWREGRVVEDGGHEGPECPGCQGRVSLPVGYTWWGGGFIPRRLGFVQCVDCSKSFHPTRGERPLGLMLVLFLLRLVLTVMALIALVSWVVWAVTS